MKAPPFAYARARSAEDALALLAEGGEDAKVIAGGQSLLPMLAYRLARPTHLVDIGGAGSARRRDGRRRASWCSTRSSRTPRLEQLPLAGAHRLLSEAAACIGHLPIRVRGTLGGSLAHADPAAELPLAAVALDASLVLRSAARRAARDRRGRSSRGRSRPRSSRSSC